MFFNGKAFGKTDVLIKSPFVQHWDIEPINPPPGERLIVAEDGRQMVSESGIYLVTN